MRHEDAMGRLPELVGLRAAVPDDAALTAHVEGCVRCQARLRSLRAIDAGLRSLDDLPPPSLELERRIRAIPSAGGQEARSVASWPRIAAAACAILVLVALVGVLVTREEGGVEPVFTADRIVRLAAPETEVSAEVQIGVAQGGRTPIRIVAAGLPHGGGRFYGLWLTGRDGAVSGGTFTPDGEGRCIVLLQIPKGSWTAVDITSGDRPPSARTTVASGQL